jgi:hypothetical protein
MKAKVYSYKTGKAKFEGVRSTGRRVDLAGECRVDLGKTLGEASKRRQKES